MEVIINFDDVINSMHFNCSITFEAKVPFSI